MFSEEEIIKIEELVKTAAKRTKLRKQREKRTLRIYEQIESLKIELEMMQKVDDDYYYDPAAEGVNYILRGILKEVLAKEGIES